MSEWLVSSWFEKVMKLLVGGSLLDKVPQGMWALMCAHCLLGAVTDWLSVPCLLHHDGLYLSGAVSKK